MPSAESRASDKNQTIKIVSICLVVVIAFIFGVRLMLERPDIPAPPPDVPKPEHIPGPAHPRANIDLAPRPLRLFDEIVTAMMTQDKTALTAVCEMDPKLVDLLVTEERQQMVTIAKQSHGIDRTEQKVDDTHTVITARFKDGKHRDVMDMVFTMVQKTGPEDWHVTHIEDQYFYASGKQAESRHVALGADRKGAEQKVREEKSFQQIPEADPVQLDYLPETTPQEKNAIEARMKQLFDESHPADSSAASQALVDIGKPAIPRLLSVLGGLDIRKDEQNKQANLIDRTLSGMAGVEMGYDVVGTGQGTMSPAQLRNRAVRRWFGWWEINKGIPLVRRKAEDIK